jgi:hypothetical protein
MDRRTYLLSAHPGCIEANYVERRGSEINLLTKLESQFFPLKEDDTDPKVTSAAKFDKNINDYLVSHTFKDSKVYLILPSEELSFRTLEFPFQDIRKIKQVLPFELGNEIFGKLSDYHYTYQINLTNEGQAKALVQLIPKERRDALVDFCSRKNLELQGLLSSSSFLAGLLPHEWRTGKCFQVYIGVDECFVSLLYEGQLITVKSYPNRIFDVIENYYRNSEQQNMIEFRAKLFANSEDLKPIQNELVWLCFQINLFLRTYREDVAKISISFHGIFASLFDWQNQKVLLKNNNEDRKILPNANSNDSSYKVNFSDEKESMIGDKEKFPMSVVNETRILGIEEPTDRSSWGILGEMPKRFPNFIDRNPLSHFSKGTPLQRFVKQNLFGLAATVALAFIFLGSLSGNRFLKIQTKQQQIIQSDRHLQQQIFQILPNSSLQTHQVINELQNLINQRTQALQLSNNFADRSYISLKFLYRLTTLMELTTKLSMERIEFSSDRFSMNGAIDSYENLQKLKSKLEIFPEFEEKRIVESNRKSEEGILYRITIDL